MQPEIPIPINTPASSDITHATAVEIYNLKHVITSARFKELTGGLKIEDLTQALGAELVVHLRKLSDHYTDFNNIIMEWNEGFSHPGINPRGQASVVPRLIDRLSRDLRP